MFTVNLTTGSATPVSSNPSIGGNANADLLQTFAVGPALTPPAALSDLGIPASAALVGLGLGSFALYRRRFTA